MKTLIMKIEGMHCEGCAQTVQALLAAEPGVKASSAFFKGGLAKVLFDPAAVDETALAAAIEKAGYKVTSSA